MTKKGLILLLMIALSGLGIANAKTSFYESNLFEEVSSDDRVAILMVHFGTSHPDTRTKTIDALNKLVAEKYPNIEQREAWTSRMVINIVAKRGEKIYNPAEALERLKEDGYTHIIIQSSNIIEGVEMESLRRDVLAARSDFKEIRVGNPLLYHPDDYEVVVDALHSKQPSNGALVLVGHGTYTPSTAQYAMVDYIIRDKGYKAMHIGTIEGYPDFESMSVRLKQDGVKDILLMPFMFVAGEHAKNDIAEDWANDLTEQGYRVEPLLEGLGEIPAIQNLFLEHIDFAIKNRMYDIIEKKAAYAAEK
ncbi:MAG: sirohydrochlorin cobaltochelatase [Rikenellaceae bacterium]